MALLTLVDGGAVGGDSFDDSADQKHPLGTLARDNQGRLFRYFQCGATATVAGSIYQSAAPIANHLANTPPAVAVGAMSFTYTPGATAGAANLYSEGYLQVDTTPGNGYTYQVAGHAAISSATAFTLYLRDAIQVALTTSSRVGLIHNPWKNCIVCPTTQTAGVAGGATCIVTAGQYGWLQTRGIFSALINGTPAVNAPILTSVTTAGAVDVWTAAAQPTAQMIGRMAQLGVSTKNNFVYLQID